MPVVLPKSDCKNPWLTIRNFINNTIKSRSFSDASKNNVAFSRAVINSTLFFSFYLFCFCCQCTYMNTIQYVKCMRLAEKPVTLISFFRGSGHNAHVIGNQEQKRTACEKGKFRNLSRFSADHCYNAVVVSSLLFA